MFETRQESILLDKTYLEVPEAIRPSESKEELRKAKMLRNDRLKFLSKAIKDLKEVVGRCEMIKEKELRAITSGGESVDDEGGGGGGGGEEEWTSYQDEGSGKWAFYNNFTGESVWA